MLLSLLVAKLKQTPYLWVGNIHNWTPKMACSVSDLWYLPLWYPLPVMTFSAPELPLSKNLSLSFLSTSQIQSSYYSAAGELFIRCTSTYHELHTKHWTCASSFVNVLTTEKTATENSNLINLQVSFRNLILKSVVTGTACDELWSKAFLDPS